MLQKRNRQALSWGFLVFSLGRIGMAAPAADCEGTIAADLRLVQQHPWRPPFGLERIGQPTTVAADLPVRERPYREFWLASFAAGKEVERQMLTLNASANKTSFTGQASFSPYPEEVALFGRCRFQGEPVEIARKKFEIPGLSAEAAVKPEQVINPVDLGAILVPHDWLLLRGGQKAQVEVAAIDYSGDLKGGKLSAWYESAPKGPVTGDLSLERGQRQRRSPVGTNGGSIVGIGWTGQWAASFNSGSQSLQMRAGMERTHLRLLPGESIRSPRIMVLSWQGKDRIRGHNLLRSFILTHHTPRSKGKLPNVPVEAMPWGQFDYGNRATSENQIELLSLYRQKQMSVDTYWLDAGWFEGGWPNGAGNWFPKKQAFPNGLRLLSDAVHIG